VALTTHDHLAPRLRKDESYITISSMGLDGLFWDELY
jgi:hypothetical protein